MSLSNEDREEIANTIRLVVNGNIKRIEEKLDGHIERHNEMAELYSGIIDNLKPVADAVEWINTTKKIVLWVGGIAAAIGGILALTK